MQAVQPGVGAERGTSLAPRVQAVQPGVGGYEAMPRTARNLGPTPTESGP